MKYFKQTTPKPTSSNESQTPIGERPEFYLAYLAFYFFPWLFKAPTMHDVIAACVAIAVFIPIYFHGFKQTGIKSLPHVAAMSLVGFAVSPFFGSHGVFHIYAMVQAGYLRPERTAWITVIVLSIIYSIFALLTQQDWWDFFFPLFMGLMVTIATISAAGRIEQTQQLQRTRELDQHLAAVGERERIAQDLHDLLGQTLTMVALKSDVATKLFDSKPKQAKQELNEIRDAARGALKDVREAVAGMNRTTINAELKRATQILASANIKLSLSGNVPNLKPEVDQVLGLAVREAMTNIARHSQAKRARFEVINDETFLTVVIEDDGDNDTLTEGSGLKGLRKRVDEIGGIIKIEQTPGLKMSIQVPNWSTH